MRPQHIKLAESYVFRLLNIANAFEARVAPSFALAITRYFEKKKNYKLVIPRFSSAVISKASRLS